MRCFLDMGISPPEDMIPRYGGLSPEKKRNPCELLNMGYDIIGSQGGIAADTAVRNMPVQRFVWLHFFPLTNTQLCDTLYTLFKFCLTDV